MFIGRVSGQVDDILEEFRLVQNDNTVIANFSIIGGASCNGVTLERRLLTDTVYTTVSAIQGVCGGSEFTEHYSLVDESPILAHENIYRLILGSSGSSKEKSLIVIELINEYNVYPQPAVDELFIGFNNPNNESLSMSIYDIQGRQVKQINNLSNNSIYVDGSSLKSGIYIFQLNFDSPRMLTGRFIKSED